jgi:hypothetical protein
MSMNSAQARVAIYELWDDAWQDVTGWAALPGVTVEPPVYYDNIAPDAAPRSDAIKVEVSVIHTDKPMDSFGNGRPNYRATGIVVVKFYVPKDQGLTLADSMVNIARRALQGVRGSSGLVLRGMSSNEEGAADRWFVVRTVTPFEYEDAS